MSTLKVATIQDTSGNNSSTPEQVAEGRAKMWINFNGTGTIAIRDDFNASSITDNGTGDYSVSFTSAMANTNYCALGSANYERSPGAGRLFTSFRSHATGSIRVQTPGDSDTSAFFDSEDVCIAIFGD